MAYNNPYQMYGNQYQPYQYPTALPQMQTQPTYQARPVTSREEALGAQVDFFGLGMLMPDLAHGIVYLKRFNQNTGASDLFEFRLAEPVQEAPASATNSGELDEIKANIKRLEDEMEKLKASRAKVVKKNDDE